ncbi:hypothetical protein STVA_30480 [Allostella vacuolata]|nr:hypothetical protein STVA_30480 [Stella vacuolata]
MTSWLANALSVIVGGVLTMLAAWLGDRRISKRDRERRREERHERLVMRRNDFQRETLLALQVASQRLLRNTGASLHQDVLAHRATGRWQRQQLPGNLSDENLSLITETILLASRVRDDEVRVLADRLRSQTVDVGFSSDEHEAQGRMLAASNTQQAIVQRIGRILRELDEGD